MPELTDFLASLRPRFRTGLLSNSFVGAREAGMAAVGFVDNAQAIAALSRHLGD